MLKKIYEVELIWFLERLFDLRSDHLSKHVRTHANRQNDMKSKGEPQMGLIAVLQVEPKTNISLSAWLSANPWPCSFLSLAVQYEPLPTELDKENTPISLVHILDFAYYN